MPSIKTRKTSVKTSVILIQNVAPRQLPQRKFPPSLKRAVAIYEPPDRYPLKIEPLPPALQWWDEKRYWLIHEVSELRIPGSFTITEAQYIREISKRWDWRVDTRDRKVKCGFQLLALDEALCKRPAKGGAR
jgi:hypothetical protein